MKTKDKSVKDYPEGQSYSSHAFRATRGYENVCFYCGLAESDPLHKDYREPSWFCRHCDYEGKPVKAIRPRPSAKRVTICPSFLDEDK